MVAAVAAPGRTQRYFATVFAARMASSHALNTYLVWLAFTSRSVTTAGWVLVARAASALVVPVVVGHVHDRGRLSPWLRLYAAVEAVVALVLGLFQLVFIVNLFGSLAFGRRASANPWNSPTLEWTAAPTPPIPHGNFETIPSVYRSAYEYSVPGAAEDFIPQNRAQV